MTGSFDDAANWSTGTVPGPGDDVVIALTGTYRVSVTSDVTVNSLTLSGNPWVDVQGASLTAQTVSAGPNSTLTVFNATLTAPAGLVENGTLDMNGGSTIDSNLDLSGGLTAFNAGNSIVGQITTHPGSAIALENPAELTVSTGLTVNGTLGISSHGGEISTLTIADGSAIVLQKGPPVDGIDQGTLEGGGQLNGSLVNNGEVTPGADGYSLAVSGNYVQNSGGTLIAHIGRATSDFSPSLLQVSGTATLGGMLELDQLGSRLYSLRRGQTDTLMTYSSKAGSFSGTQGLNLGAMIGATAVTVTGGHRGTGNHLPPDLTVAVKPTAGKNIIGGSKGSALVAIVNLGAGPASGSAAITLYASTDTQLDPTDTILASQISVPVHLSPKNKKVVKIPFRYPTLSPGNYYVIASIMPSANIADSDPTNNSRASSNTIHLS